MLYNYYAFFCTPPSLCTYIHNSMTYYFSQGNYQYEHIINMGIIIIMSFHKQYQPSISMKSSFLAPPKLLMRHTCHELKHSSTEKENYSHPISLLCILYLTYVKQSSSCDGIGRPRSKRVSSGHLDRQIDKSLVTWREKYDCASARKCDKF